MGPLAGIRVLDLTTVLAGPGAAQALGQMGADVVKVEPPEGDIIRYAGGGRSPSMSPMFLNANRAKRAICLDLKRPEGRAALDPLIAQADVLLTNVREAALVRLGLDYETLGPRHPRLIHAAITGYASGGPLAGEPAYDDLIQGGSGMAWLFAARGGTPEYVPSAVADRIVGHAAVGHVCAALFARERSGQGQRIEVPMFEIMAQTVLVDHLGGHTFRPQSGPPGYPRQLSDSRRPFASADGHVCAMVYNDKQWGAFLAAIGVPDLPQRDPRFASFAARTEHVDHVYGWLAEIFRTRSTAEWLELLRGADVPCAPVRDIADLVAEPQLADGRLFAEIDHPSEGALRLLDLPARYSRDVPGSVLPPPLLGQHGRAILAEAGMTGAAIEALVAAGVLHVPDADANHGDA